MEYKWRKLEIFWNKNREKDEEEKLTDYSERREEEKEKKE